MKIWDLFVRISHWLLVVLVAAAYLAAEFGGVEKEWHFKIGIAILVLVLSRVVWALVGSSSARFSRFLVSPMVAIRYLADLKVGKAKHYIGHNPAGGWMVLVLWGLLIAMPVTGMFSSDDIIAEGPLAYSVSGATVSLMTRWHNILFNVLVALVVVHVAAVLFHHFIKKEDLITAMFSGKKAAVKGSADAQQNLRFKPLSLALLIVAVIGAAVVGGLEWLNY